MNQKITIYGCPSSYEYLDYDKTFEVSLENLDNLLENDLVVYDDESMEYFFYSCDYNRIKESLH